jgi:putative hydrolase of the HAD superfamily
MKYQAVIFDLFGTLVPSFSEQEYRRITMQMASMLSMPEEEFWQKWKEAFVERILGTPNNLEAQITDICLKLGRTADREKVRAAAQVRVEYGRAAMVPRPDAVEVLSRLKIKGLKTGLITDCSSEAPMMWNETPIAPFFDVTIFSCLVGMKKPDPRIYRLALERLKIEPGSSLYIGDGSSRELTGASQAGMTAVQLRIPGENDPDVYRVDREDWEGKTIASLTEVLSIADQ